MLLADVGVVSVDSGGPGEMCTFVEDDKMVVVIVKVVVVDKEKVVVDGEVVVLNDVVSPSCMAEQEDAMVVDSVLISST